MNGNIIHDIRAIGGLGKTLANAPVQAELDRVHNNYPRWVLPQSLVSFMIYSLISER